MKYVALLRGINVGWNKKVDMKELKKITEKLGYTNVSTYINSGNLFFETDEKKNTILKHLEKAIEKHFGFSVSIILRNEKEIQTVCDAIPKTWENDDTMKADVIFLWDEVNTPEIISEIKHTSVDTLIYIDGAVIWWVSREEYNKSGMHDFIGTRVYKCMTARNVNTTRKILEIMNT